MFQPNNNPTFGLNNNATNTSFGQPNQFGQQPTFGAAPSTSFGATNNTSVFGQNLQNQQPPQQTNIFGTPQPTNNVLGSGTSSIFPSTGTSFGGLNANTSTANTFGQQQGTFNQGTPGATSTFGSTTFTSPNVFGASPSTGSVFGQAQPQSTPQTTGLFGSQTGTLGGSNLFQTPNTSFGINPATSTANTTFGAPTSTANTFGSSFGMFQSKPNNTLFGASSNLGNPTFGSFGSTTNNTVRFNPPTGTDYIQKNGSQQNVPTRHQNITAMKEYESKSVEELRMEDYAANRKGSQNATTNSFFGQQSSFGTPTSTAFGATNNTSVFGQTLQNQQPAQQSNIFGTPQPTNNVLGSGTSSIFPSTGTSFGGLNTSTSTANTFGQQQNTFNQGTAGTTSTFGSTTFTSPNVFGASPSMGSVFGQAQPQSTPQTTGLFGSQTGTLGGSNLFQTPNTSFGINPATSTANTTFGAPTSTATTFGASSGMFQTKPNNTLFGTSSTLGTPTFGSFGSTNNTIRFNSPTVDSMQKTGLGTTLGSQAPQTLGSLNETKPGGELKLFGANNTVGQNFDAFNSSSSLFGGSQQNNPSSSLFNFNSTSTPFGQNSSPFSSNILQQQQQHQQQQQMQQANQSRSPLSSDLLMNRLRTLPYGDTSVTQDDLSPAKFTTDPRTLNQYKMSAKTNSILTKPSSADRARPNSVLFDGLDDPTGDDMKCALDVFVPKRNIKKLVLKSKPNSNSSEAEIESPDESPSMIARDQIIPNINESDDINDIENSPNRTSRSINQSLNVRDVTSRSSLVDYSRNPGSPDTLSVSNASSPSSNDESGRNRVPSEPFSMNLTSSKSAVTLNRLDYQTQPSLDELERLYNPETKTCIVNKFLIERNQYGSILFEQQMDIKGLNLDEIVHIRRKEVVVYPDDNNKPPVGQGLNRPAIITLHQVWPVDKKTHEVIKDINRLNLMKYSETIETATIRKGARFIDYRPQTGSWVFAVKHFSKYGLTEDDETVQPAQVNAQARRNQLPIVVSDMGPPTTIPSSSQRPIEQRVVLERRDHNKSLSALSHATIMEQNMETYLDAAERQTPKREENNRADKTSLRFDTIEQIYPGMSSSLLSSRSGDSNLSGSKTKNEQEIDSNILADLTMNPFALAPILSQKYDELDLIRNSIFDDEDIINESKAFNKSHSDSKRALSVHGTKRIALHSPNNSGFIQDKISAHDVSAPKQPKIRDMKLKPDLYAARNKLIKDVSAVRVCGSPKIRFINGSRTFSMIQGDCVTLHELKIVPSLTDGQLGEKLNHKLDRYLTSHSTVTQLQMKPTLAPYIETDDFIDSAESHDLLHALYGNLTTDGPYAKQNERLLRVVDWLSSKNFKLPVPTNIYQRIIYHLTCDRYDLASSVAMDGNHPRLALLVSSANVNKDLMIEQLDMWRMSCADQYIDRELLKIYVLLAGLTDWKTSDNKPIDCLKGLEWTQQLSLLILHVSSFVSEPDKYGFHLLPQFLKRLDTDTNDVDFHILSRNNPSTILSAASRMNLSEEWFLLESLKSFHIICTEMEWADSDIIHCNMVAQLGAMDLRWACFIALHIVNNDIRNKVLIKCLEQNIGQICPNEKYTNNVKDISKCQEIETWLIEKLKIPKVFIENAKI